MNKFLNNFSISSRMFFSISFFIVTLLMSVYQAHQSIGSNIDFATKEKMGNAYQRPLAKLLNDSGHLRTLLALTRSTGGSSGKAQIKGVVSSLDNGMAELKEVNKEYGVDLQFTEDGLKSRGRGHLKYELVEKKWTSLRQAVAADPANAELDGMVASYISDIRGMIAHSGDTSNLILDPDLDSYYLMDVTLLALPQTMDRLSVIASTLYPKLGEDLSLEDKTESAVMSRMLKEADMDRVSADMDTSLKEDPNFYGKSPTYEAKAKPALETYIQKNTGFDDTLKKLGEGRFVPREEFVSAFNDAREAAFDFWNTGFDELDGLLDARISAYQKQQMNALLVAFAGIMLSTLFYLVVLRSLLRPINSLTNAMTELAANKINIDIPYEDAQSEIGKIAKTLLVFKKNAEEKARLEKEQSLQKSLAEEEKKRAMRELADAFQRDVGSVIDSVNAAAANLQTAAKTMTSAAEETARQASSVSDASEKATTNVQVVASATEELSASVHEIQDRVVQSNGKVQQAAQQASLTTQKVSSLTSAANKIGEVVKLITDIATQTNLLALNATIEAARAGDAGKGFAVVASEVKNLSGQTAQATEQIVMQIKNIQDETESSANAIRGITQAIEEVNQMSAAIAAAVSEQGAATQEIARNVNQASHGTASVSTSIECVSDAAQKTGSVANQVLTAAEALSKNGAALKNQLDSFLQRIKAA